MPFAASDELREPQAPALSLDPPPLLARDFLALPDNRASIPEELYLLQTWNSGAEVLRLYELTGAVDSAVLTPLGFPAVPDGWVQTQGPADFAPQRPGCSAACEPNCKIQTNDSRIQNLVLRDTVTVKWSTDDDTATVADSDYVAVTNQLVTFPPDTVWAIDDNGSAFSDPVWTVPAINPSAVLLWPGEVYLYVGVENVFGDAVLLQIDTATPDPNIVLQKEALETSPGVIGPPSLDNVNDIIHVGSEAGILYAAKVPLVSP